MNNDSRNNLIRFALHNSNLPKVIIKPDSIENENANNAGKLARSKKPNEKIAGKMLIKLMADDGNEVAEAVKIVLDDQVETNSQDAKNGKIDDQKQKEKKVVKECWEAWQSKPDQYKNKTAFATAMIDKFRPEDPKEESKHLFSVKKITEWCTRWGREKIAPS